VTETTLPRTTWTVHRNTAALAGAALGAVVLLLGISAASRPVVLPLVALLVIAIAGVLHLARVDGQLPAFDVGALTIFATTVYSVVPLIGFWLAGLRFTAFSYLPLWLYYPGPQEVGGFAWRHVTYLASFTAMYLLLRGRAPVVTAPIRELRPTAIASVLLLIGAALAYFALLGVVFGVSYDPSYSDLGTNTGTMDALPYVLQQLSHNLFAMMVLLKVCVLMWLMARWAQWRWRAALIGWLLLEGVLTVTRMGGRTWYVTLLMAAVLLYHRQVKPLPFARAGALAVALLGATLVYGMARDIGGGLRTVAEAEHSPWATMNEFQALYGISYDLYMRRLDGTTGPVPWQIYASDLIRLVPSQVLPFEKADPCLGYPQVDGVGLGCVLGVISNAVIGLDWVELVLRGLGLGLLFALLHRWYVKHQQGYWATLSYLCLCLWCYYTFRGSTLYFAYFIVYRLLPVIVAVRLTQAVLRSLRTLLAAAGV
jgi:hypothetical protein